MEEVPKWVYELENLEDKKINEFYLREIEEDKRYLKRINKHIFKGKQKLRNVS